MIVIIINTFHYISNLPLNYYSSNFLQNKKIIVVKQ